MYHFYAFHGEAPLEDARVEPLRQLRVTLCWHRSTSSPCPSGYATHFVEVVGELG